MLDSQITDDSERERRLRAACTRFVHWHGDRSPAALLTELPSDIQADSYGNGGVVAELEETIAALLGKPAAVFMVSGTMAQQSALRIHADRSGRRTVAFHPTCHLELHEDKAYQRLHGLVGRPVGDSRSLLSTGDLEEVAEPLAALVLELPQRELGGQLPTWDELGAQVSWARQHGAAVHLDGARLWECKPHYNRSYAEIAALFDTVYVSFYKGLGALSGCCLAGSSAVIAQAREWRTRHGGTLFALWPYAASALGALRRRLDRMPDYHRHAVAIARALRDRSDVAVVPDPPHTPLLHLYLRSGEEALRAAILRLAEDQQIWTWPRTFVADHPQWRVVELAVGDATLDFTAEEVCSVIGALLQPPATAPAE